jgi:hypothetical protein
LAYLLIYSYVHTVFGPSLSNVPCPLLLPPHPLTSKQDLFFKT